MTETGRLVGGPHDGTTFPVNDRFWHARPDQLPEPAQRVYVTEDGHRSFWFTASVTGAGVFGPPPLSRYDLDPDDSGWLYQYVGEEQHG